MEKTKTCNTCFIVKPLSDFYFSNKKLHYFAKCKCCSNKIKRSGRKREKYNVRLSNKRLNQFIGALADIDIIFYSKKYEVKPHIRE